jgi:hypothetical protein
VEVRHGPEGNFPDLSIGRYWYGLETGVGHEDRRGEIQKSLQKMMVLAVIEDISGRNEVQVLGYLLNVSAGRKMKSETEAR